MKQFTLNSLLNAISGYSGYPTNASKRALRQRFSQLPPDTILTAQKLPRTPDMDRMDSSKFQVFLDNKPLIKISGLDYDKIVAIKESKTTKITEALLKKIIKEELQKVVNEMAGPLTPEQKAQRAATRERNKKRGEESAARLQDYFDKLDATPPEERTYSKKGKVEATPEEYESATWSGSAGTSVWRGEDGKYYKTAVVPATEEEYESAKSSGSGGTSVWRNR